MYKNFLKRILDITVAFLILVVFAPLFLVLMIMGAIEMKGNPFFMQKRPGYKEKIFKLIKFRTMTNEKDENGGLLADERRLTGYGRFLRSSSLDELPEVLNILLGDMSVIGPRPWLVEYLPYYTREEHRRHEIKPGLTGWAQVNGRNTLNWDDRIRYDIFYVDHCSFCMDMKIVLLTVEKLFKRSDIQEDTQNGEGNLAAIRKQLQEKK